MCQAAGCVSHRAGLHRCPVTWGTRLQEAAAGPPHRPIPGHRPHPLLPSASLVGVTDHGNLLSPCCPAQPLLPSSACSPSTPCWPLFLCPLSPLAFCCHYGLGICAEDPLIPCPHHQALPLLPISPQSPTLSTPLGSWHPSLQGAEGPSCPCLVCTCPAAPLPSLLPVAPRLLCPGQRSSESSASLLWLLTLCQALETPQVTSPLSLLRGVGDKLSGEANRILVAIFHILYCLSWPPYWK